MAEGRAVQLAMYQQGGDDEVRRESRGEGKKGSKGPMKGKKKNGTEQKDKEGQKGSSIEQPGLEIWSTLLCKWVCLLLKAIT